MSGQIYSDNIARQRVVVHVGKELKQEFVKVCDMRGKPMTQVLTKMMGEYINASTKRNEPRRYKITPRLSIPQGNSLGAFHGTKDTNARCTGANCDN